MSWTTASELTGSGTKDSSMVDREEQEEETKRIGVKEFGKYRVLFANIVRKGKDEGRKINFQTTVKALHEDTLGDGVFHDSRVSRREMKIEETKMNRYGNACFGI
jgi:hypothetical protein